jgi:hypothetical protein
LEQNQIEIISKSLEIDSQQNLESQIISQLKLTYEERIQAHENALQLMLELKAIGEKLRAKSQSSS